MRPILSVLSLLAATASAARSAGSNNVQVHNQTRSYVIHLPDQYDNNKAYRVIFAFHATGGSAKSTANSYYGMLSQGGKDSILISPQGNGASLPGGAKASGSLAGVAGGLAGWWHVGGKYGESDIDFIDKILDATDAELCVDTNRRFSTGFSFGGVISYSLACLRSDKFRGVSVQSGANLDVVLKGMATGGKSGGINKGGGEKLPGQCVRGDTMSTLMTNFGGAAGMLDDMLIPKGEKVGAPFVCPGNKPVAYMGSAGICDGWIEYERAAKDDWLKINRCAPKKFAGPIDGSSGRVTSNYECEAAPVVWTEFDAGHMPTGLTNQETWNFFSSFG
jgi:predicted esterase